MLFQVNGILAVHMLELDLMADAWICASRVELSAVSNESMYVINIFLT